MLMAFVMKDAEQFGQTQPLLKCAYVAAAISEEKARAMFSTHQVGWSKFRSTNSVVESPKLVGLDEVGWSGDQPTRGDSLVTNLHE